MILALEAALAVAYTLLAHLASAWHSDVLALAALLVLLLLLLASALAARRAWALLALPLGAAGAWWLYATGHAALPLLLVPVAFVAAVAWVFGRSLRGGRVPLITRIVAALDGVCADQVDPEVADYARGVTLAWAIVLAVLALVNLLLAMIAQGGLLAGLGLRVPITITREQWSWFANLCTYGLVGGFFVAEFLLRQRRFPGRDRGLFAFMRRMAALGPGFWRDLLR